MLGENGMHLVRAASRLEESQSATLPPFAEETINAVVDEMQLLFTLNQNDIKQQGAVTKAVHLRHAALERNRRCLLIYLKSRMDMLQQLRWQTGPILSKETKDNLSVHEQRFVQEYNSNLAGFMRRLNEGRGLDLMSDLQPPKTNFVDVRCLKDYGEVETDDGDVVVLKKNAHYFLPTELCEPLIRQGVLKHLV